MLSANIFLYLSNMKRVIMLCLLGLATSTLTAQATTPVPEQKQEVVKFDTKALSLVDFKITNVVLATEIDLQVNNVVTNDVAVSTVFVKEKSFMTFEPDKDVGWQRPLSFYNLHLNTPDKKAAPAKLKDISVIRIRADA